MAAATELAILDGRYQMLRQIGGPPNAPLMLASDLRRGVVVCVRLKRFSTAMARLAAVPRLAPPGEADDGPLLPFDFGVDGDVAYLVRPYVAAISLEVRLADGDPLPPLEALRIVTGVGQALLAAVAQGFSHPGLKAKHVLITPAGNVRVAGFDALGAPPLGGPADGRTLVALLRAALAQQPSADLPEALRRLLVTLATWERRSFPTLRATVQELARAEARLSATTRPALALRAANRAVRGAGRRLRRLGPLLRPYLITAGLLAGTAAVSAAALSTHGGTNHITVYAVAPAPAAADPAPQRITIATAAPQRAVTTSTAATTDASARAAFGVEQAAPEAPAPTVTRSVTTWSAAAPLAPEGRSAASGGAAAEATLASTTTEAARLAAADQRATTRSVRRSAPRQTVAVIASATYTARRSSSTAMDSSSTAANVKVMSSRASVSSETASTTAASVTTAAATAATRSQATASARATQTTASTMAMGSASVTATARATNTATSALSSVATSRASNTTASRGVSATTGETSQTTATVSARAAAR